MSLNKLFYLNIFILLNFLFIARGSIISNDADCSELEKINKELLLKIEELEKRNKELEEEIEELKRREEEKEEEKEKEKEEEKEDEKEIEIYNNLDSKNIENFEEFNLLYKRLKKNGEIIDFKLLYRKSRDGIYAKDFHNKCDGISKTISIVKSNTGYKFGGYSSNKWSENFFTWVYDDYNSFVFSLNLMKIYDSTQAPNEKYHLGKYSGPQFWAFTLADDTGYTESDLKPFGETLQSIYHDGYRHFSGFPSNYEINGGKSYFYVSELEVFQIVYKDL